MKTIQLNKKRPIVSNVGVTCVRCEMNRAQDQMDTCARYQECLQFICKGRQEDLPLWAKQRERVCPETGKCERFVASAKPEFEERHKDGAWPEFL